MIVTENNEFVLSLFPQHDATGYPHLLLSAGACSTAPADIDRYLIPAGHSAANPPATIAAVERWDRRTNKQ